MWGTVAVFRSQMGSDSNNIWETVLLYGTCRMIQTVLYGTCRMIQTVLYGTCRIIQKATSFSYCQRNWTFNQERVRYHEMFHRMWAFYSIELTCLVTRCEKRGLNHLQIGHAVVGTAELSYSLVKVKLSSSMPWRREKKYSFTHS